MLSLLSFYYIQIEELVVESYDGIKKKKKKTQKNLPSFKQSIKKITENKYTKIPYQLCGVQVVPLFLYP